MAGITTRITTYIIVFCYCSGLLQALGVLPASNSAIQIDGTKVFNKVSTPNQQFQDPFVGAGLMVWQAVQAFIGSLVSVVYIFGVITQWGIDPAYAYAAQGIVLSVYVYDAIALWKGIDIL